MKPALVKGASRLVNACRLVGRGEHRRRVRSSRRVMARLRGMMGEAGGFPRCMAYLRKVDPLVFEEIVLSALEDGGAFVLRNRRYTGDGGIDGSAWVPGVGWVGIQAKRYGQCISHEHVRALSEVVKTKGFRIGLFVHTGRTGPASHAALRSASVLLVSGGRLLRLIQEGRIPPLAHVRA